MWRENNNDNVRRVSRNRLSIECSSSSSNNILSRSVSDSDIQIEKSCQINYDELQKLLNLSLSHHPSPRFNRKQVSNDDDPTLLMLQCRLMINYVIRQRIMLKNSDDMHVYLENLFTKKFQVVHTNEWKKIPKNSQINLYKEFRNVRSELLKYWYSIFYDESLKCQALQKYQKVNERLESGDVVDDLRRYILPLPTKRVDPQNSFFNVKEHKVKSSIFTDFTSSVSKLVEKLNVQLLHIRILLPERNIPTFSAEDDVPLCALMYKYMKEVTNVSIKTDIDTDQKEKLVGNADQILCDYDDLLSNHDINILIPLFFDYKKEEIIRIFRESGCHGDENIYLDLSSFQSQASVEFMSCYYLMAFFNILDPTDHLTKHDGSIKPFMEIFDSKIKSDHISDLMKNAQATVLRDLISLLEQPKRWKIFQNFLLSTKKYERYLKQHFACSLQNNEDFFTPLRLQTDASPELDVSLNEHDLSLDVMKRRYDELAGYETLSLELCDNVEKEVEADENVLETRIGVPQRRSTNLSLLDATVSLLPGRSKSSKRRKRSVESEEPEAVNQEHIYTSPHRQHMFRQARRN